MNVLNKLSYWKYKLILVSEALILRRFNFGVCMTI